MRGALCLAESKRKGEQNVWLYGCPTILQIHYFNSVDTGYLTIDTTKQAAVKLYSTSVVRTFIEADTFEEDGQVKYGGLKGNVACSGKAIAAGCIHYETLLYLKGKLRMSMLKADSVCHEFNGLMSKDHSNDVGMIKRRIEEHDMAQTLSRLHEWKDNDAKIESALKGKCGWSPDMPPRILEGVVVSTEDCNDIENWERKKVATGSASTDEDHDIKTVAEALAGMKAGLFGAGLSGACGSRQGTCTRTAAVNSTKQTLMVQQASSLTGEINKGVALIGDEIKTNEGTLEGDGGKQKPVLKFYVRRLAKNRDIFLDHERTNERCTVLSESVKTDEMNPILAHDAFKKNSLGGNNLSEESITAVADADIGKKRSISQINRLIEVCKRQRIAAKMDVPIISNGLSNGGLGGPGAYFLSSRKVLKDSIEQLENTKGMELRRIWIEHPIPVVLQITGTEIYAMMKPGGEVGARQFDIFRRLVYCQDKKLYAPRSILRLRKVLHLSWAERVLNGAAV
ncbi:uncharacterized protein [Triticum aestivum]|uniref:uncharacterized protein isoform X2 n=1 Tax=Triticum aestivum TaxID=4565 RepID=UPI001D016F69|nr:uncharacterized protein LOC123043354 isoform X2 [Triticum aestivum]XP_044321715.1 uncharacterized protein LOC123043354 isoform X2 [Triticum aestivum]